MGLDMYAYSANKAGAQSEYWDNGSYNEKTGEFVSTCTKPKELAYWRKHPNLHGWMERLWEEKGRPGAESPTETFNGVELELTWDDIEQLEFDIQEDNLPGTTGFFFGDDSDDYYKEQDLEFVKQAKADLFLGLKVYYNSSW
jgi:hypothetical protein